MNRFLSIATACVVCTVVACAGSESAPPDDPVSITMFQAAPANIEAGQTSTLMVTVNPPEAEVTIAEVGDMTGRTGLSVSPTVTTTYRLTATSGSSKAESAVTITVGPQPVMSPT